MDNSLPTVVVVDDNATVHSLFKRSADKLDIDLKTFSSADESMAYLGDNQPDLLFLDIIMPHKDGLTFLQELRNLPLHKTTSVIMISSKDYDQDRTVANELGALEFVIKPMPIQTITDIILKYTNSANSG
ncbi:MAG: response regulator [Gammaproteobacteria bacterium]